MAAPFLILATRWLVEASWAQAYAGGHGTGFAVKGGLNPLVAHFSLDHPVLLHL
jgi:hypothetical protein